MIAALLFVPLLAALIVSTIKNSKTAKYLTLVATLAEFGMVCIMLSQFVPDASFQFVIDRDWITALGIRFKVGVDGISMLLVLLTAALFPLIVWASFKREYKNNHFLLALALVMQSGLMLVFTALDAFAFYVGWEVALIPVYFICAIWGGENRIKVNLKFFIYTILGSLFMLLGIIYLHLQTPDGSFDWSSFANSNLSVQEQGWLFWAFFLAFAIKIPVFPFHTWQPDTYTEAPTIGTMLLAGIMLKMGIYGLIRWILPVLPLGLFHWGQVALVLALIGVVYAALIAFTQKDVKRLIAYSSIGHVGLIALGTLVFNAQSLQGAMIQMLNHGLSVVGLFLIVDILQRKLNTREISAMGGIAKIAPNFSILFLIILLGAVALPLTNGFVGEFLLLSGIFQYKVWLAVVAGLSVIFGAVYMLRMYQSVMQGTTNSLTEKFEDVKGSDAAVLIVIALLTILVGLYPKPLLNISEAAVEQLVKDVTTKLALIK